MLGYRGLIALDSRPEFRSSLGLIPNPAIVIVYRKFLTI